jgi:hypothetical protein
MTGLVWASERTYRAIGTRLRLRSEHAEVAAVFGGLMETMETAPRPVPGRLDFALLAEGDGLVLYRDGCVVERGSTAPFVLRFLREANQAFVKGARSFAVHAAVIGAGRSVAAVVGASGIGKTTLTAACLLAGAAYGSDEALVLEADQGVRSYPRPLLMSSWSLGALGLAPPPAFASTPEAPLTAAGLGAPLLSDGARLTHVVIPTVAAGADPAILPAAPTEAMAELIRHSFNHYLDPRRAFDLTAAVAGVVEVVRFRYSDPLTAGRRLVEHLAR